MYPKKIKTLSFLIVLFSTLIAFYPSIGAEDTLPKVDILLTSVASYEYGQSREPLSDLSDIINSAYKSPEVVGEIQTRMLKVLRSDATSAGKQFICRQLSIIGTDKAVPTLAKMLRKEETSDMARYALERIPGSKADKALRKALRKTSGDVQVGIINSLGQRGDAKAVKVIGKKITDPDPEISLAAASALGKIAGPKATEILAKAKNTSAGTQQRAVLDAYLKCADKLADAGEKDRAASIYQEIFHSDYSGAIRAVALRGLFKSSKNRSEILVPLLKTENDMQTTAIDLVRDLPKSESTLPVSGLLSDMSAMAQVRLIAALSDRGDRTVLPDIRKAARSETVHVRVAAIDALAVLGDAAEVDLVAKATLSKENEEKEAARKTLYLLPGRDVDKAILAKIPVAEPGEKVELIRSVANRGMDSGLETLFKATQDSSRKVKVEAIKTLADVAPPSAQSKLIQILLESSSSSVRREAEKCLTTVARKIPDREKQSDIVLAGLSDVADVEARGSLLQVLGNIGSEKSLPVLRDALKSDDESLQAAGIRALSQWPDQGAADDLLGVAKKSENETFRILALRGYIRLIDLGEDEPGKIAMLKTAMALSTAVNEKRQVLSGLAKVKSPLAIDMAVAHLADPELKSEAAAALGRIAWEIRDSHTEDAVKALKKIIKVTDNDSQRNQAQELLERLEKN